MPANQITCPQCQYQFEVESALSSKIEAELKEKFEKEKTVENERLRNEYNQKYVAEIQKKQAELEQEKKLMEQSVKNQVALELKDLQEQNTQNKQKLAEANQRELDLMKQKRELEEAKQTMELEIMKKVELERKQIIEQTKLQEAERTRLELAEKDKQMEQLKKSLEEANRRANQGSQQIQGDVQENDLKAILSGHFLLDQVEDVPTGKNGADLIQNVSSKHGYACGKILWESKRTQRWSDDWVQKLKTDQMNSQADIAIIATQAMPEGITTYGNYQGIWVVQYNSMYILALAAMVRHFLEEMYKVKNSQVGKDEKMEYLYNYLTSPQFSNKIRNIVEAFSGMKEDLDKEKAAMQKLWGKREKEITRVIESTASLYGDLQGMIGPKLEKIEYLELGGEVEETTQSVF